eukprot:CAMPEP_0119153904 /NCGR_PEP_ID=MMETSP1310-20130426/50000_1 /TAXON_ID=464262 /ORGANISM="Genus nov. species nov., Strain RCC2339" /LENGTH=824 /DNA_ID=CAMNT_0007146387 /DNA_START=20 /DNA_END=2494 /DNA_ORIENTATION=-
MEGKKERDGREGKGAELDALILEAQTLSSQMGFKTESVIQRNPTQLLESTQRLSARVETEGQVDPAKAHYLLARRGFDLEKQQKNLGAIEQATSYGSSEAPLADSDLDGFLRQRRAQTVVAAIEEARGRTTAAFDAHFARVTQSDWEEARTDLLEGLGHLKQPTESLRALSLSRSAEQDQALDRRAFRLYGWVIRQLNFARFPGTQRRARALARAEGEEDGLSYPADEDRFVLIPALVRVAQTLRGHAPSALQSITASWRLLQDVGGGQDGVLRERAYVEDHHVGRAVLRRRLMERTCASFERHRRELVRSFVSQNPRKAERGGEPGFRHDVESYLRLSRPSELPGRERWAPWEEVFYCLRCGEWGEALQVVKERARDREFEDALRESQVEAGGAGEAVLAALRAKYSSATEENPFREACYNLVGRCDPGWSSDAVLATIEDYLWYRLSLAHAAGDRGDQLRKLQQEITRWGPEYFEDPLLYFHILLSIQCYEEAVKFLLREAAYQTEAVHFALVLYYVGLLRQPLEDPRPNVLSGTENDRPFLAFARLAQDYVSHFAHDDAEYAFQYLLLIREEPRRVETVRDLLLDTRAFDLLAGSRDGSVARPGLVAVFLGERAAQAVYREAAQEACCRGHIYDSVMLFVFAEQYTDALAIINRQLSRVLSLRVRPEDRTRTMDFASRYRDYLHRVRPKVAGHEQKKLDDLYNSLELLLWLACFFDAHYNNDDDRALQIIAKLGLLPADRGARALQQASDRFDSLDDDVKRAFSDILLVTMKVLHRLYQQSDSGADYSAWASTLVAFCSKVEYQITPDATAELTRLALLMS